MPILIKDYSWKQTDERIIVRVPLKGVDLSKADIFTCDNFIKVHSPPFLFEVCLRDLINEENSICRLAKAEVIFELKKQDKGTWDILEAPLTKEQVIAVKQRAIEKTHHKTKTEKEARIAKKQEIKNRAVNEQIALDTKERNKIEDLRENEKKIAMDELEEWKQNQMKKNCNEIETKYKGEIKNTLMKYNSSLSYQNEDLKTRSEQEIGQIIKEDKLLLKEFHPKSISNKEIFNEAQGTVECLSNKNLSRKQKTDKNQITDLDAPLPRNSMRIGVTFTPRSFPTPSRESQQQEENEWLQKQAEARRRAGFVIEDLRPEEHDPTWLKDKGDSFYKVGNYIGAISAYSHGIKLNPQNPTLYSNRAAAHLAIGNLRRVVQDTTMALELFVPKIEMNASSRSLCHARRGAALCQLNILKAGLADLEKALELRPDNKELQEDIKIVKKKLEDPSFTNEVDDEIDNVNNEIVDVD